MAQSSPRLENIKELEVTSILVEEIDATYIHVVSNAIGSDANEANNVKLHRGEIGQLEVVAGNDSTVDGFLSPNKVQINVKNALIGTHTTVSNNVKLHRSGDSELGFVLGNDSTAEGNRSSANATIQATSFVIGNSPNQSFNARVKRVGNGLIQFVLASDTTADGSYSPDYADVLGSIPIGSVVAWNPGYYTNASNGSFTNASFLASNNVAGANGYLNPRGFYVADGSVPSVTDSLIWSAAGRHLPNLTDDRFLQGSTAAGGIGGSNVLTDHTHAHSLTAAGQTLGTSNVASGTQSANHSHSQSAHNHTQDSHGHSLVGYTRSGALGSDLIVEAGNVPSYTVSRAGVVGATAVNQATTPPALGNNSANHTHTTNITHTHAASSVSGTVGSGVVATSTENRPKYLSNFYIVRVF